MLISDFLTKTWIKSQYYIIKETSETFNHTNHHALPL